MKINQIYNSLPEQERKLPLKVKQFLVKNYEKNFYENTPYHLIPWYYHYFRGNESLLPNAGRFPQPITGYVISILRFRILTYKEHKSILSRFKWGYTIPSYIDKEKTLSFYSHFLFTDNKKGRGLTGMAQNYLQKNISELTEKDLEKLVSYSINKNYK